MKYNSFTGNLRPIDCRFKSEDSTVLEAKKKLGFVPKMESLEQNRQKYLSNPENLKIGDFVLTNTQEHGVFRKSYMLQRGLIRRIYRINFKQFPPTYQLKEMDGRLVHGRFYK